MSDDGHHQLAVKLDAFFARVRGRYPGALHCEKGCSACCHQHLSVVTTEFRRIAQAVLALPGEALAALAERLATGRDDPRCPLLDDAGACRVYAVRPVICRSHGLAMLVPGTGELSVCPYNFVAAEHIDGDCVLDLSPVNNILTTLSVLLAGQAQAASVPNAERAGVSQAIIDFFGPETVG